MPLVETSYDSKKKNLIPTINIHGLQKGKGLKYVYFYQNRKHKISTHFIDANLCLHILKAFLQDGDESCRGH